MIDIILSTYNDKGFITELIDSLNNQSFKDFKLIIRDDGSNKIFKKKICNLLKKIKVVEFYNDKKNIGHFQSYNFLLTKCTSDLILICDQDDIWHPNKVENYWKEFSKIQDPLIPSLIYSDLKMINDKNKYYKKTFFENRNYNPLNTPKQLLLRNSIPGCAMGINKALKNKYLLVNKHLNNHDHILAMLTVLYGQLYFIAPPLIDYRIHSNNTIGIKKNTFEYFYQKFKLVNLSKYNYCKYVKLNYKDALMQIDNIHYLMTGQKKILPEDWKSYTFKSEYPLIPTYFGERIILSLLK